MADEPLSTAGSSRLSGTNHLQTSIDSLKSTVDRLNQNISQLGPHLQQMNRLGRSGSFGAMGGGVGAPGYPTGMFWGRNGGQSSGQQQQQRGTNGGGATFSGKPGSPSGPGGGSGGAGGTGGGGGQGEEENQPGRLRRMVNTAGGGSALAYGAAAATGGAISKMINGGAPGMYTADLMASQLSLGGGTSRDQVLNSMKGKVTGLSMGDVAQGRYTLTRGLGIKPGSAVDQGMQSAIGVAGLINPGMGNAQVAQAAADLNAPDITNKLRGIGVDVGKGPGSAQNPLTLANQILQKIGNWQSINTSDKITFNLDDPNGAIETTLRNWEAHGYLPPGTRDVIKEEIRSILIARMNGMSFQQLQTLGGKANAGDSGAAHQLQKAGVNPKSIVQSQKNLGAAKRDRDLSMTDSFAAGAETATGALQKFTDAINWFLSSTKLGDVIGVYGGVKGTGILPGGGGGNGSDIGAMGSMGSYTGGQPEQSMGNSSQGVPLSTTSNRSGSNSASGAPGTSSGSGKTSAGKKSIKFIRPVNGPITSPFGSRTDPLNGRTKIHTGIDFGVGTGTPIHASAAGTVIFSGSRGANYWAGNHVIIDHGGGYQTLYAHQSRVKARVGSSVQQGEIIGYSGATGRVTGPHLHFEIHINGHPVDPMPYLSGASVQISASNVSASSQGTGTTGTSTASSSTSSGAPAAAASPSGSIITSELQALAGFSGATASSMNTGTGTPNTTANTTPSSSTNASGGSTVTPSSKPGGGSGVERWRAVALQALKAAGAPTSWIGSLLHRMNQESSGNPKAINNWDSNAKAGHPSQGLMQTIPGTFNAYAGPYRSRGIYDPFANIYAAIKYTVARYGSGPAGWDRSGGYATGAWEITRDEDARIHKGEMIIPAKEARQIREVLLNGTPYKANAAAVTPSGGLQITIEQGAITITTSGSVTPAGVNDLGKAIADQIAQNDKIKKLTQGVLT